ncbi:heavy metal-responsive transcriptional regulator [Nocardia halotolerans]|uniref:Heavy metal-responsive transcriptional regulator n=1 Tax=Nocardia halotolerans TaxID=1755878 RepID=A0ABV8VMP1_9NOCA
MRIGELAAASGVTAKTIRFYEQEGLIAEPARTSAGYRDYDTDHIARLRFIRQAQAAGLTLAHARQILGIVDRGDLPCGHVESVLAARLADIRAKIVELTALETRLADLLDTAHRGSDSVAHEEAEICWILESSPPR